MLEAGGRTPGKVSGLRDVNDAVHDRGDRARGIFHNAPTASNDGQHGVGLAAAAILAQHHGSIFGQFDDAAGREEGQGRREFRRFHGEFDATVRTAFSGKVEGLPLGNPIGAFPLTIVLQLRGHRIQLGFEVFGALIELKLCEALFQDGPNVVNGVGFQEVQHHGVGNDKLTVDGFRVAG